MVSVTNTYNYTGAVQTLTLPADIDGNVTIEVWGAGGGYGDRNSTTYGGGDMGAGAYVKGTLTGVQPGETLYIYVGGRGESGSGYTAGSVPGGWNGGGYGGDDTGDNSAPTDAGGGGGGATDVRRGGTALSNRIIVAGGGGGGAGYYGYGNAAGHRTGGHGGYPNGAAAIGYSGDTSGGGTQTGGGVYGGTGANSGNSGTIGQGGNAANGNAQGGGGGGGGYYGGGGGGSNTYANGGGGGSSYYKPEMINVTASPNTQAVNYSSGKCVITYNLAEADTTPPTATHAYPLNGSTDQKIHVHTGEITLYLYGVTDNKGQANVYNVEFNVWTKADKSDARKYAAEHDGSGNWLHIVRLSDFAMQETAYYVEAIATDLSGNKGTLSSSQFTLYNDAPTTTSCAPEQGTQLNNLITSSVDFILYGVADDVGVASAKARIWYEDDPLNVKTVPLINQNDGNWKTTYSFTDVAYFGYKTGRLYIEFTATDVDGKSSLPRTIYIDIIGKTKVKKVFSYTGAPQEFVVPDNVDGKAKFSLYGGNGSAGSMWGIQDGAPGGKGAYISGEIFVKAGEIFTVHVGGSGGPPVYWYTGQWSYGTAGGAGGWNGGGAGGDDTYSTTATVSQAGGGGGGATDIRYGGISLDHRVLVAGGGGGGGGARNTSYAGGNAGYPSGANPSDSYSGYPGTQTAGGNGGSGVYGSTYVGGAGTKGIGGNGRSYTANANLYQSWGSGGGGGGYYGGGAGSLFGNTSNNYEWSGGGGGGSSYYDPSFKSIVTSGGTTPDAGGNGMAIIEYDVYSPVGSGTTIPANGTVLNTHVSQHTVDVIAKDLVPSIIGATVSSVEFHVWSKVNWQADSHVYEATFQEDGTWKATILYEDFHQNDDGLYRVDCVMTDSVGAKTFVSAFEINVANEPPSAISHYPPAESDIPVQPDGFSVILYGVYDDNDEIDPSAQIKEVYVNVYYQKKGKATQKKFLMTDTGQGRWEGYIDFATLTKQLDYAMIEYSIVDSAGKVGTPFGEVRIRVVDSTSAYYFIM